MSPLSKAPSVEIIVLVLAHGICCLCWQECSGNRFSSEDSWSSAQIVALSASKDEGDPSNAPFKAALARLLMPRPRTGELASAPGLSTVLYKLCRVTASPAHRVGNFARIRLSSRSGCHSPLQHYVVMRIACLLQSRSASSCNTLRTPADAAETCFAGEGLLSPSQVLVALHSMRTGKDGVPLLAVMTALTICLGQRQTFNRAAIAVALEQLVDRCRQPA